MDARGAGDIRLRLALQVAQHFDVPMKDRQGARRFSMHGLDRCRGEWLLDATMHNLRKLHQDSVRRTE